MAVRTIQSKTFEKGHHYLIEFEIDKGLAIVSEDAIGCGHQVGDKVGVYILDRDGEQNEDELHSDEYLESLAKKQKKETDTKYSNESKRKDRKRKQQSANDDFAIIDVIYPDLQSHVTSNETTDDVTITKVVQANEDKCSCDHTPGSHSEKACTSVPPHEAINSHFLPQDYSSVIEDIKARLNKIEDFLSSFGYKKDDDSDPPPQLPSTLDPPQSSLATHFMLPPITELFLSTPLANHIQAPSEQSVVNHNKPGSSVHHVRAPTQESISTPTINPLTQQFIGTSTHNNIQPPTQQPISTPQSHMLTPKPSMSVPQSQPPPPPFHVPPHPPRPNLLLLKQQSVSRSNFAKNLLASLISEDEWITLNVSGTRGKRQINPSVVEYVRLCTFSVYPLDIGEDMEMAWKVCVKAIDAGARAIAKKRRQSM